MAVRDLLLDDDGDLAVANGDLALVSDLDAVKQGITLRLLFFRGEYWLDESVGVPWHEKIINPTRKPNPLEVREALRAAIASTPDVLEVTSLAYTLDPATRRATIGYEVRTVYSASLRSTLTAP